LSLRGKSRCGAVGSVEAVEAGLGASTGARSGLLTRGKFRPVAARHVTLGFVRAGRSRLVMMRRGLVGCDEACCGGHRTDGRG